MESFWIEYTISVIIFSIGGLIMYAMQSGFSFNITEYFSWLPFYLSFMLLIAGGFYFLFKD